MDLETLKAAIDGTPIGKNSCRLDARQAVLKNLKKRELLILIESAWLAKNPGKPICCYVASSTRQLRNTKAALIRQLCYYLDQIA